ncbi:MAG: ATP-binding cassette domain-containing protein [Bacteroidetes bacterium]|nr:ATP-binding cassette domain-containing protein [Bacteroidota bacterium]
MNEKEPILSIRSLCKRFGSKIILSDFQADLYRKENLVVMGKSGAGKSVLIKCIVGLIQPDSGSIRIHGEDMTQMSLRELQVARRRFGFLFQSGAIYDSLSVRENLEFPLRRVGLKLTAGEILQKVEEALDDVGLLASIDLMPSELSGGMRKRVGLARTIILQPEIILYDEPTTGLDAVTGREIISLINRIKEKYHASSIIITHDNECIRTNSDRIVLLHQGASYVQGDYPSLLAHTDPFVKQFFL